MNKPIKKPVQNKSELEIVVPVKAELEVELVSTRNEDVELLREQLDASNRQISELKDMMLKMVSNREAVAPVIADPFDAARWITLVHLEDRAEGLYTIFRGSNGTEYRLNYFGQTRKVKLIEFEDIMSRHRKLFDRLVITVSSQDNDIAEAYNLPKIESITLKSHQLAGLVNMTEPELQEVYIKVCDTHKALICRKWQIGYWERADGGTHPKNVGYKNIGKVTLLNELSNGAMSHVLSDIEEKRKQRNS